MEIIDWLVLLGTVTFITLYGVWKTRRNKNVESYLKGKDDRWATIGLSVMATQASAITFLSTPGQAYASGIGFVQFYFGMPLALIVLSIFFIPIYYKLNVYTAYEYLEKRFDLKNRLLAASIFLLQRGLAAGITIYAPSIILSTILGWNLALTNLFIGIFVIVYTVSGGTKAVSLTQKQQMTVIMLGMFIAFFMLLNQITEKVSLQEAFDIAGYMNKLEVIDTSFSFDNEHRYTLWSGLLGGFFLFMSYFGTDQSQVQRYLSGKSATESRLGLMFNALLKIPMQFFILFVGVMVFVFYQLNEAPLLFNQTAVEAVYDSKNKQAFQTLEQQHEQYTAQKQTLIQTLLTTESTTPNFNDTRQQLNDLQREDEALQKEARTLVREVKPAMVKVRDSDFVFLQFVLTYLPNGIIGLLLAVIFSAAMSSTASELNALASTTAVDFYQRFHKKARSERHYFIASKFFTAMWGSIAIVFALFAHLLDSLIEAVNILGSIFYGTVLGIFLCAFFIKILRGTAVFWSGIVTQLVVIMLYCLSNPDILVSLQAIGWLAPLLESPVVKFFIDQDIAFLWYNAIGCLLVVVLALLLQAFLKRRTLSQ
ncbi:MAG: sodium:solute symporter [Thermonemataceae bacterium]